MVWAGHEGHEMSNATAAIINKLDEVFAPMDALVLESAQEWAKGRVQALREFQRSEDYVNKCIKADPARYYQHMYMLCTGKTWYNVFNGNSQAIVAEFVAKNCAATAKKRNAAIAAKLEKVGVVEVISEEFYRTADGFNGEFVVDTNAGRKTIAVNTGYAGGYNIQCLHLRVLVKVR
jgi:hypothetical protein